MKDPEKCIAPGVSTEELKRRWALAREVMRADNVDFLVMRNDEEFLGGYVRWFTDIPARHSYPYTVIFPADEEMTLVSPGPFAPRDPGPPPWSVRGVKNRLGHPILLRPISPQHTMLSLSLAFLKRRKTLL